MTSKDANQPSPGPPVAAPPVEPRKLERTIGLLGATGIGIGAIVGGGILALAGVAFRETGPGAVFAFAINGGIAFITAISFAELGSRFPESGGTYNFAKKVLSVQAAFIVGWLVWFASIVAGVLYAVGFGAFAMLAAQELLVSLHGEAPGWITGRFAVAGAALLATGFFTFKLARSSGGGGQLINVGKTLVFIILIAGGLWAIAGTPRQTLAEGLTPMFPDGGMGLLRAMGFTFIALQGFDLIAAVAGEIKQPQRNVPRAMFLSLGSALAIYIPLLIIIATVGMAPGVSVQEAATGNPEAIVPEAARQYLGAAGYWLVMAAALLSMLSALQANLLAASRISFAMARDRTLPRRMERMNDKAGTPIVAVLITSGIIAVLIVLLPDVAAAGAASSLIFLITFALAHWISVLARQRSGGQRGEGFRAPLFPLFPIVGALACVGLGLFQGVAVPTAGIIVGGWVASGVALYLALFARRARVVDAASLATDPTLVRLRGRSPLVLVPIANPKSAEGLVTVANAITPRGVGRVLLLSVVVKPRHWEPGQPIDSIASAQAVLGEAMSASTNVNLFPEAITTIADRPWPEIARVARLHRCQSLLLGFAKLSDDVLGHPMDDLIAQLSCDVVVLRARPGWQLADANRVLVPVAGRGGHDTLRARLLGSLATQHDIRVTYLRVVPAGTSQPRMESIERGLRVLAADELRGMAEVRVIDSDDAAGAVTEQIQQHDLTIMGLHRSSDQPKAFGAFTIKVARNTDRPLIMINHRPGT